MNKLRSALAIGAALCVSSATYAETLTFNDLANTGYSIPVDTQLANYHGYAITVPDCPSVSGCLEVRGSALPYPWSMDRTGAAISAAYDELYLSFSRTDHAAFNLISMDLADYINEGMTSTIRYTFGFAAGGFEVQTIHLDSLVGGQTVDFSLNGVTSFSMVYVNDGASIATRGLQFDNMVVTTDSPVIAAVPEPQSWAMMAGGMAALGFVVRRRAQA